MSRLSWDEWGIALARAVALRSDCTRRQIGAVVMDDTHSVVATGYNGAPSGRPGCLSEGACPRGRHYLKEQGITSEGRVWAYCACGTVWPCPDAVELGSSYDTGPGSCIAIHAEANALLRAGTRSRGATLYLTEPPCDGCARLIEGAGIRRVIYP